MTGLIVTLLAVSFPSCADEPKSGTSAGPTQTPATVTPTSTATPAPTAVPTSPPTSTPMPVPTAAPTVSPTPTATPQPTPTVPSPLQDFENGLWLEQEAPQLASSIKDLDWVRDGIEGVESETVQHILNLARESRPVASAVVSLSWIQDGIDNLDLKTVEYLSHIADEDSGVSLSLISLDWVQDGINDLEARAIYWIKEIDSAEVASSVVSLGWIQDGIEGAEIGAIDWITKFDSAEVALAVVSLGLVQDGISNVEAKTLGWISNIESAEVASAVVSMGWLEEGISDWDVVAIEKLARLANEDAGVGLSLVWADWVRDGIDDADRDTISAILNLATKSRPIASAIVSMDWVQDGIEGLESDAIGWIGNIESSEVASALVSLGWVQDGIDRVEGQAIEEISYLAYEDAGAALRVVGMPFIETIEPPDVSAVKSLRWLAAYEPEAFESVMSHATLQDGITDDWAHVVATLYGVATRNPGLIDVLLDVDRVTLERRTITLPLSGDVFLSIIRTGPGVLRSMDLLEHSVHSAEEYMDIPLPTNYITVLFENAVHSAAAAENFGTHVAILPDYDTTDETGDTGFSGFLIAHEVAHYYWTGNATWVDEGAAEFMTSVIEDARTGHPIEAYNSSCEHAGNIAELESLNITLGDIEFDCNYSLGEGLFLDLYRTLGDARFQEGFRKLYEASQGGDGTHDYWGTSLGIDHVREAFGSGNEAADEVIARWYDGT